MLCELEEVPVIHRLTSQPCTGMAGHQPGAQTTGAQLWDACHCYIHTLLPVSTKSKAMRMLWVKWRGSRLSAAVVLSGVQHSLTFVPSVHSGGVPGTCRPSKLYQDIIMVYVQDHLGLHYPLLDACSGLSWCTHYLTRNITMSTTPRVIQVQRAGHLEFIEWLSVVKTPMKKSQWTGSTRQIGSQKCNQV